MSWKEQYKKQLEERDDSPYYRLAVGANVFRVLPNFDWVMSDDPGEHPTVIEYLKHKDVGPKKRMVTCGKTIEADGTVSGSCWLCDAVIPKYASSSNEKERGRADDMHPVPFSVLQVSPVKSGKFLPPKVFEMQVGGDRSYSGKIMNFLLRPDRFYEHPLKGRNFVVHKAVDPTKKGPKATSYPIVEVEEEATKVPRAIFDMRKPLTDLLPVYDEAEQRAALKGEDYQRRAKNEDEWATPEDSASGYDESEPVNAEEADWNGEGYAEEAAAGEEWGEGEEQADGYAEEAEAEAGWGEAEAEAEAETEDWGEAEAEAETVSEDHAGWGDADGTTENEEWTEGESDGSADDWEETPPPPPVKKGPPPVKKGAPPPVKKGAPPPVKKGPPPPVKKGPPPVKKGAPPPVKKGPPPPVKKGPPPPVKKGPPPSAPPVKKGPPPPVKKGAPPRR